MLDWGTHQSQMQTGQSLQAQQAATEQIPPERGVLSLAQTARSPYRCSVSGWGEAFSNGSPEGRKPLTLDNLCGINTCAMAEFKPLTQHH